ncbi:hypothetical protein BXU10_20425 [Flavobacterium sp. LM4]|nr:hypothetical protein BXU10_20420 [Flavobacterium sp. LM4]OOV16523.1 hypothetical protein BXU10_20425 [Flavobacterium sp. LM4]
MEFLSNVKSLLVKIEFFKNNPNIVISTEEKSTRETLQRWATFCTELLAEISPYVEMTNWRGETLGSWVERSRSKKNGVFE